MEYNCEHLSKEVFEVWKEITQELAAGGAIIKEVIVLVLN